MLEDDESTGEQMRVVGHQEVMNGYVENPDTHVENLGFQQDPDHGRGRWWRW